MRHRIGPGADVPVVARGERIVRPDLTHRSLKLPVGGRDLRRRDIELGAVAGREHGGFADRAGRAECAQERTGLLGSECQ